MIKILLPDTFKPERRYVIDYIFNERFNLDYFIEFKEDIFSCQIILPNNNSLKIEDHFFGKFKNGESYLSLNNIPKRIFTIDRAENPFLPESNIPIIYGQSNFNIKKNNVCCGIDIIASIFFMLTRWEEIVNPARDKHQRFPAKASIAQINNFLKRPVVDEYIELMWNILSHLGIKQKRKEEKFKAIITHDVDIPLFWKTPYALPKKIAADILKRRSFSLASKSFKNYTDTKKDIIKDPFDTFDFLMNVSERNGLKSHFFFLCGGKHRWDKGHLPPYHPFIKNLMKRIDERGHIIGFHPSYDSYLDEDIFKTELSELQKYSPQEVKCGRQHFLRFSNPDTWRLWNKYGMEWESSLYYAEEIGFRCGTSHDFFVFDIKKRKQLNLKEIPLTYMEVTQYNYEKHSPEQWNLNLQKIINSVKKYKGIFNLLWHNSSLDNEKIKKDYTSLLNAV